MTIDQLLLPKTFQSLTDGLVDKISFLRSDDGAWELRDPPQSVALFPGSFNPLHDGHQEMARIATKRLERQVWLEISVGNVEKSSLTFAGAIQRLKQFENSDMELGSSSANRPSYGVVLTTAATFSQKLDLFPESVFVVGADTIVRINELRFYRDADHRSRVFQKFASPCSPEEKKRFLVFGRWREQVFELDQIKLEPSLAEQCEFVSQGIFENRISSTQVRRRELD